MFASWLRAGLASGRITMKFARDQIKAEEQMPTAFQSDWADLEVRGMAKQLRRYFGSSLFIRHIDVGSCNACESEVLALTNPYYNMHQLGVFFTPSPRHADVLLVTGALTPAMRPVLLETYQAMPKPRIVIAAGVCPIHGGVFASSSQFVGPVHEVVPVDVYIKGCPPTPLALLRGLLQSVQRGGEWQDE